MPVGSEFERQTAREHPDAGLGDGVLGAPAYRDLGRARGDVDDRAAFVLGDQLARDVAVGQHHAGEVDREDALPELERLVGEVPAGAVRVGVFGGDFAADVVGAEDACRGDAVVETAELVDRGLDHRLAIGIVGHIDAGVDGAAVDSFDHGDGLGAAGVIGQAGDDDGRALAGEPDAGLAAHAAGTAGDERDAAFKPSRGPLNHVGPPVEPLRRR